MYEQACVGPMGCLETSDETWELVTRGRWAAFWHMVLPISTDLIGAHPTSRPTGYSGRPTSGQRRSTMYSILWGTRLKQQNVALEEQ